MQVAPLARVAGPIVAAAVSWVTPCGSSSSRHVHVLHTLAVTSAASILSSIAFFLQTSKWGPGGFYLESVALLISSVQIFFGPCQLYFIHGGPSKICSKTKCSPGHFCVEPVGYLILLHIGCYFDVSNLNLNLCLVCHMNSSDVTSLMLTCELTIFLRLQNGLQVSEGSGRPSKEDLRSPGENKPPFNRIFLLIKESKKLQERGKEMKWRISISDRLLWHRLSAN